MPDVTAAGGGLRLPANASEARAAGLLEREAELGRFDSLLGLASEGAGRMLLVEGEAGVGKTALLRALSGGAHRAGFLVWTVSEFSRHFRRRKG